MIFAVIGLIMMLERANLSGSTRTVLACSIYGGTAIFTFLSSTIYHYTVHHKIKHFFHILDHIAIFLMIAGTYTPFTLITLRGPWGWSLFATTWGLAFFGILFKIVFTGKLNLLSTAIYTLMGWLALIAIVPIMHALPEMGLFWLILGGILYTIGVVFYLMESVPFAHTIWHLFVIAGSITQFICIYQYVAIVPA